MHADSVTKTIICFFAITCAARAGAEVHRYEMENPVLQIYPANMKLTKQQQHAALYTLANDMKVRSAQDLADFVRIALEEMAGLYEEEARRSGTSKAGKSISYRWTDTTMTYANDLYRAADKIDEAVSIDIAIDDTGELMIVIDGRPYLVSSPVLDKPLLLDQRIIDRVCQEISCAAQSPEQLHAENRRAIIIDADWVITAGRPPEYVTSDGLHFVFSDLHNRSAKQIACLKLIKELELLAGSLRDAAAKGVTMDPDQLTIQSLYGSYDYRVRLNQFGDTIYIKLPELNHAGDWITQLWPWLHAQLEGLKIEHYLQADAMLSYTLKKTNTRIDPLSAPGEGKDGGDK